MGTQKEKGQKGTTGEPSQPCTESAVPLPAFWRPWDWTSAWEDTFCLQASGMRGKGAGAYVGTPLRPKYVLYRLGSLEGNISHRCKSHETLKAAAGPLNPTPHHKPQSKKASAQINIDQAVLCQVLTRTDALQTCRIPNSRTFLAAGIANRLRTF